jgi:hypothetical protein
MPPSAEATGFIARYIDFLRGMRSNPGAYPGFSTVACTPSALRQHRIQEVSSPESPLPGFSEQIPTISARMRLILRACNLAFTLPR